MGRTLYVECAAGISGDMTVAALLDLGADREKLLKVLETVPADGFKIKISRVSKSGIDCADFAVLLDAPYENHDHDMEYLYGHAHPHDHGDEHCHHHKEEHCCRHDQGDGHHHDEEHCCRHDHEDGHHHHHHDHGGHEHGHSHVHRNLTDVYAIIDGTQMTDGARALAKKIFRVIAEAEAKAHGVPLEEVHFHEVGAVDSIVDVISIAVCFDDLSITDVIIKSVSEGYGTVRCQHGILPVPVPAVTNILQSHHLPLTRLEVEGELVTPTGAAFLAAVCTKNTLPAPYVILRTGLGAGKRTYAVPGILRMFLIEP